MSNPLTDPKTGRFLPGDGSKRCACGDDITGSTRTRCKPCHAAYMREFRKTGKPAAAEKRRYAEKSEHILTLQRAWNDRNREHVKAQERARYAANPVPKRLRARREVVKTLGPNDLEYGRILLSDPCSYCGGPGGVLDHITPVVAGGTNDWHNLTSSCRTCNSRKSKRSLLTFLLKIGGDPKSQTR